MNLMTNCGNKQHADSRACARASYYLLDRELSVISAHTYEENGKKIASGTSFFELFPAARPAREEICTYLRSFPRDILLTLCGRTPVLLIGTFLAHTGLALAVIPQGELKKTLSYPAAFHRIPRYICVSASAQKRYKQHDEHSFANAGRWLASLSMPFARLADEQCNLPSLLAVVAERLSAVFNVPVSFDFSGLGVTPRQGVNLEFAIGVMLATWMAAKRSGCEEGVRLYGAMEGNPTLYLEYSRRDLSDGMWEALPLIACAQARGVELDVVVPNSDPARVQVRAGIGIVELSAQGVRERHDFLEGKSPLALLLQAKAFSLPFPDLSLN